MPVCQFQHFPGRGHIWRLRPDIYRQSVHLAADCVKKLPVNRIRVCKSDLRQSFLRYYGGAIITGPRIKEEGNFPSSFIRADKTRMVVVMKFADSYPGSLSFLALPKYRYNWIRFSDLTNTNWSETGSVFLTATLEDEI
jgi:hypothetical protein